MKMKWLPLLLLMMLQACAKTKEPEFRSVENFRIISLDFTELNIGLDVTWYNPNNFSLTVKEAEADVYVDSLFLGKFIQKETIEVGKNVEFSIPFSGKLPIAKALQLDFKNIGEREILLTANGTVKVGKAGIFVNKTFKYSGKHRLSDIKMSFFD